MTVTMLRSCLLASGALASALAGCGGSREAEQMRTYADQLCACVDQACAEQIFVEVAQYAKASAGTQVSASSADAYDKAMRRAQACHAARIPAATAAAPGVAP